MDFRVREALRKSRIFLIENVIFDEVLDHLIDQDIFSDSMLEYIKAAPENVERIRRLLDHLVRRPDNCFQRFLTALTNSHHDHCTQKILENFVRSGATQTSSSNHNIYNQPVLNPVTAPPLNPQPPDEHVPMESSSSYPYDKLLSQMVPNSEVVPMGFPETSSSMQGCAGSYMMSFPVQESSVGGVGSEVITNNSHDVENGGFVNGSVVMNVEHPANLTATSIFANTFGHQTVYERHRMSNPQTVYKMESVPRGLVLIINNENFTTLTKRTGSKRDMENLHVLFKKMGFDICHEADKTAKEIRDLLKTFTEYNGLRAVDALAVVILSHGGRDGIIFGKNGSHGNGNPQDYIRDEEIRDQFNTRNCPVMAHKPKLVIIQACRGLNEDVADGVQRRPPPQRVAKGQVGTPPSSVGSSSSSTRIANMADMCLIHSTVQGYVSYRHPVDGSPFIQEMTKVFQEMATREHLTDLMTMVNRNLASRQLQEDLRTVPSTTNTLTKKWFLNPLNVHE